MNRELVCAFCGKKKIVTRKGLKFCSLECYHKYRNLHIEQYKREEKPKSNRTLCWDCIRSGENYCSWVSEHKPIDGWEVKPSVIGKVNSFESLKVLKCPLYQ